MSLLKSASSILSNILRTQPTLKCFEFQQIRNMSMYTKWRNLRDMNRRRLTKESAPDRLRLLTLMRCNILPKEISEEAHETFIKTIPKCSSKIGVARRCVITGRGYGTVYRWRVSRLVFRHLADYNKLSGIQRAMW